MRNGFWLELDELRKENPEDDYDFSFMENYTLKDNKLNAFDFLHGFCNEFADYLHEKYGYSVEAVREYGNLIHMYCTAEIDGETHFIDIRGICDDWDEFMQEFTDAGLWENMDRTRYLEYEKVPRKHKLKKSNEELVRYFDEEFGCYAVPQKYSQYKSS